MTTPWVKERYGAPAGFFETEAAGLTWLAEAGAVRVAAVLECHRDRLVLERLESVPTRRTVASSFGAELAKLHAAGASTFGELPRGARTYYFGPLGAPLDLGSETSDRFDDFYVQARIRPAMDHCDRVGVLTADLRQSLETFMESLRGYGTQVRPARVHGDLWNGNIMWTSQGVALIDPAACGNHPLADLAMLRMFGVDHLEAIEQGYEQAARLAPGWRDEIPIHQVFGLLVHLALFGPSYASRVEQALRASLRVLN